jgi:hypothetical protein
MIPEGLLLSDGSLLWTARDDMRLLLANLGDATLRGKLEVSTLFCYSGVWRDFS